MRSYGGSKLGVWGRNETGSETHSAPDPVRQDGLEDRSEGGCHSLARLFVGWDGVAGGRSDALVTEGLTHDREVDVCRYQ
jgi:hypothetical protein